MLKWSVTNNYPRCNHISSSSGIEKLPIIQMIDEDGIWDMIDISDKSRQRPPSPLPLQKRQKVGCIGFVDIDQKVLEFADCSREAFSLPPPSVEASPLLRTAIYRTLWRLNSLEAGLLQCSSSVIQRNVSAEIDVCRKRLEALDKICKLEGGWVPQQTPYDRSSKNTFTCNRKTASCSTSTPQHSVRGKHIRPECDTAKHIPPNDRDDLSMSGQGRVVFMDSRSAARARKRADEYFEAHQRITPEDKVIISTNEEVTIKNEPRVYERSSHTAWRSASCSGTGSRPRNTVLISVRPCESGIQTRVNIHLIDPGHATDTASSDQSEPVDVRRQTESEYSVRQRGLQRALSYQGELDTVGKLTRCASYGDGIDRSGLLKQRAPSVEDILENIRKMNKDKPVKDKKRKAPQPNSLLGIKYNNPKHEPVYNNSEVRSSPILSDGVYQNLQEGFYANVENWYDTPKQTSETAYENIVTESEYENLDYSDRIYSNPTPEYCNLEPAKSKRPNPTYDVPKPAIHIYDSPLRNQVVKYDQPKKTDERFHDKCDSDSLESEEGTLEEPDIPAPDYFGGNDEYYDEGIGESDSRSYYTEDQGLEVIPEEPEEEEEEEEHHISIKYHQQEVQMTSDDSTREYVRAVGSNTSLGSLGGSESEGIGSAADGESHSSGESTHGEEIEGKVDYKVAPSQYVTTREPSADEKAESDRCVEVYNETVRQRNSSRSPRVSVCEPASKEYAGTDTLRRMRKFLPSVRALRNQFEIKKEEISLGSDGSSGNSSPRSKSRSRRSSMESDFSVSSVSSKRSVSSLDTSRTDESFISDRIPEKSEVETTVVDSIVKQFAALKPEMITARSATAKWDPTPLVKALYALPTPVQSSKKSLSYINTEGYLEKLPSGRKKATFWNAWKRRYFKVENGYLYYYQSNQNEKPSLKVQLMGGEVECGENNMLGIDDGKGHYIAVRCLTKEDADRWKAALLTQFQENFNAAWVHPIPIPNNPSLFRDVIVVDLGSCSVRAGLLSTEATLPQLFFPAVAAKSKSNENVAFGYEALKPKARANNSLKYPLRTTTGVNKYALDMETITGFLTLIFRQLNVDPSRYSLQLCLPRSLPPSAQVELLKIVFDHFNMKGLNLAHQSVAALAAYNASSGIVVDIGERMDIVPIMDGYMLDSGMSRVPYGGHEIAEHVRQFLLQKNYSLVSSVETFLVRLVLERLCYVSGPSPTAYHEDLALSQKDPLAVQASLNLDSHQGEYIPWGEIVLETGRFQAPEGLFHPEAWGLDHPGVHKLVARAIQECSVDIRKEMSRSIYLAGGVTMLPGFAERLEAEIDRLTPQGISPKVHASPYRYHAAYLGASVFANSSAFEQSRISREDWQSLGPNSVRKWKV